MTFLQLRRALGMTQVQLAAALGVSQGYVSTLQRGRKCSIDVLQRLQKLASVKGVELTPEQWSALHDNSAVPATVSLELYARLQDELRAVRRELATYKQET